MLAASALPTSDTGRSEQRSYLLAPWHRADLRSDLLRIRPRRGLYPSDGPFNYPHFSQLPTFQAKPISRAISISVSRESPRQMTVFPGGATVKDAGELAKYERLGRGNNAFMGFVARAIA
jgi:hypothetical protein